MVSTVAVGKQVVKNKIVCSDCGKEKDPSQYYTSNSPFHKHTGKLHLCKECFWDFVDGDVNKLKNALRMIDKPFLINLLESSKEEAERDNKDIIKIYMKNVAMNQYKNNTWDDSDFEGFKPSEKISINKKINIDEIEDEQPDLSTEDIKYLRSFWGKAYNLDDLIWLQSEYEDWTNRYECDSKGMETLIQEICKQQLDINTRRANGEKVDQQLKTFQDLLGSSNLKPVQETGANAIEQESFGTLIKKFEREKPIPEPDLIWKDVDGIGKYIRTFFFGHMAKAIGAENKFQKEYEEELNKFTVQPNEEEENYDE
jgi:hypothetical protein